MSKKSLYLILLSIFFIGTLKAEFYAEISRGLSFLQTKKRNDIKLNYNPGYIIAASLGYRECSRFHFEGELVFRRNSLHNVYFFGQNFSRNGY